VTALYRFLSVMDSGPVRTEPPLSSALQSDEIVTLCVE
jgi:hypothetical protein